MWKPGRATGGILAVAALIVGCSAPSGPTGGTSQPPGSSAGPTPTSASPSTKPGPSSAAASVDLTLSGTVNVIAKGSKGRCVLIARSDGSLSFGFEMTEADYPGVGQSFSLGNFSGSYVDIKWVVDDKIAYGDASASPVILSADHHSVDLDGDLSAFTPQGGSPAGPEHAKGHISCP